MIQKLLPRIIPATLEDYLAIQNMAQFYVYDTSRDCGFYISSNGLYEPKDYRIYFENADRKAFLVKIDEELAGFALLNQVSTLPETDWNIGEFFILARFQGKGIGRQVACHLWKMYPGFWEVSVLPENKSALAFWRKTVSGFTGDKYREEIKNVDYDARQPRRYILSFDAKKGVAFNQ